MNFLGMGLLEILVVLFIAFVVLGPERMVEASRKAGRMMADLRRMNSGLRETLTMDEPAERPSPGPRGAGGPETPPQDAPVDFRAWRARRMSAATEDGETTGADGPGETDPGPEGQGR